MDDDERPRPRGDAASLLVRESLDSYSRDELDARINQLEAEIERVKTHKAKVTAHMSAAEALFRSKSS